MRPIRQKMNETMEVELILFFFKKECILMKDADNLPMTPLTWALGSGPWDGKK